MDVTKIEHGQVEKQECFSKLDDHRVLHLCENVQILGEHESQVSEGGEVDLHRHLTNCKKNPGHTNFLSVQNLTLSNLQNVPGDSHLFDLIKTVADLTVRVSVRMTSTDRPEFWPDTTIPFFLSNIKGSKHLRTGSGMVSKVLPFTKQPCTCIKCQHSESPSSVSWVIYVDTAAHVVFDQTEASHTCLRLFYDAESSPVVSLNTVSVETVIIERDLCQLKCITCDPRIGNKLDKLCEQFENIRGMVNVLYKETRDVDRVTFIVSHPHGCSKQVSIGQWKDKYLVDDNKYFPKFTYTTSTCPGSSGAPVHCVGYNGRSWMYQPVHSGTLNFGLNYSVISDVL